MALADAETGEILIADIREQSTLTFSSGPSGIRALQLLASFDDLLGDVNGDRVVDADDAVEVLEHVTGVEGLEEFAFELAELSGNDDGGVETSVSPYDAALILRYVEQLQESFPVAGGDSPPEAVGRRVAHLSEPQARADGSYEIPVFVDDADGVFSGQLHFAYDPGEVAIAGVRMGDALPGHLSSHVAREGELRFAFAGSTPGRGRGEIAVVEVVPLVAGGQDMIEHVQLQAVEFNEGSPSAELLSPRPERHFLYPAAPNPFNSSTVIRFGLPAAGPVVLSLHNVIGQRVRTLISDEWEAGLHQVVLDDRDRGGHRLATGVLPGAPAGRRSRLRAENRTRPLIMCPPRTRRSSCRRDSEEDT